LTGADLKQAEALIPLLNEEAAKSREMAAKIIGETPAAPGAAITNVATDIDCEDCGKPMTIRSGRRGKFLGCSGYPKCKNTMEIPAKLLEELGLNGKDGANGTPVSTPPEKQEDEAEEIETDLLVE
jgi:ssDNA-binding Zn-finger/Zn-ribbon topoisomerase 1